MTDAATLEICVEGVANARRAAAGGADRIELCADLAVGGITPSAGAIAMAVRLGPPVQVLIRPSDGEDFRPTRLEYAAMLHDIRVARRRGAAGIVLGLLRDDRRIDRERTARLIEAARPLSVTFHKAFDRCPEPLEALRELMSLGVDRVLTSGGAATARDGLALLAELQREASGRLAILAGGRVRTGDIAVLRAAGIQEIHAGSAAVRGGRVDPGRVRRLIETAHRPIGTPRPGSG